MAKKAQKQEKKAPVQAPAQPVQAGQPMQPMQQPVAPINPMNVDMDKLPKETQEKLKDIKAKLEKLQKRVLSKFGDYIAGISLLPPERGKDGKEINSDKINALILVDDTDSQKMSKYELKQKLQTIVDKITAEIDKNLIADVLIFSELWQSCYDAKYDLLNLVAISAPIFDKGMLAAIKISEIHKSMVLKKFEKYIVSYVLSGSLVRGEATKTSDIDVFIVIDDTDVKKMTRAEP